MGYYWNPDEEPPESYAPSCCCTAVGVPFGCFGLLLLFFGALSNSSYLLLIGAGLIFLMACCIHLILKWRD